MPRVTIDASECIGCESCVEICPQAFRLNALAVSEFVSRDGLEEHIQTAIDACPTECIRWDGFEVFGDVDATLAFLSSDKG